LGRVYFGLLKVKKGKYYRILEYESWKRKANKNAESGGDSATEIVL